MIDLQPLSLAVIIAIVIVAGMLGFVAGAHRRARAQKLANIASFQRPSNKRRREGAEYFAILSVGTGTIAVTIALLGMMAVLLVMLFGIDERVDELDKDLTVLRIRQGLDDPGAPSPEEGGRW